VLRPLGPVQCEYRAICCAPESVSHAEPRTACRMATLSSLSALSRNPPETKRKAVPQGTAFFLVPRSRADFCPPASRNGLVNTLARVLDKVVKSAYSILYRISGDPQRRRGYRPCQRLPVFVPMPLLTAASTKPWLMAFGR
jgi:hypothetical protein